MPQNQINNSPYNTKVQRNRFTESFGLWGSGVGYGW